MGGGGEGAVGLFELCNPHLLPTPVLQELLLPLHLRPQEREEVVRLARRSPPLTSHLSPWVTYHQVHLFL